MFRWLKKLGPATRFCGDALLSLACWTLWLALVALLVVQIGIALSSQLTVPKFVLRNFEARIQASNIEPRFGRATFDPRGRILLENVQLSLPAYHEPVVDIRAVFLELDPWLLLAGQFEPLRLHATGVRLFIPAMLAPSGRSEEMLGDLELVLRPTDDRLVIDHLATRLAGMTVTAQGAWHHTRRLDAPRVRPLPLLETLAQTYPALSRRLVEIASHLSVLEQPHFHAELTPSPSRGAFANTTLTARRLELPQFHHLVAHGLRVSTRFPLLGDAPSLSAINASADTVHLGNASARHLVLRVHGTLDLTPFSYTPRETELASAQLSAHGLTLDALTATIDTASTPKIRARLTAENFGLPFSLEGLANLADRSATAHFTGSLSPSLLDPIGEIIGRDLRPFIDFGAPVVVDLSTTFAPGWKFQQTTGRVAAEKIDARNVFIDSAQGEVFFDGRHFTARHARATLGDNFARGSFEQDLSSLEFRFLLEGHLRPLAISGWFRDWWPNFFNHFDFPLAPPNASVEVAGRWLVPHETSVFVFAENYNPVVRGALLDYARTRMFIRPNFIDGLELFGTRDIGEVRGTFTRRFDLAQHEWRDLTLSLTSTVDLATGAALLGPTLSPHLEPFVFARPPRLRVTARFDGPASPDGPHQHLRIEANSTGAFSAYRFPARNLSFNAILDDDELTLQRIEASVAGGTLSGHARLWGPEADRQLGFDATLDGASLGQAAHTLTHYLADRRGDPPPSDDKLLPGKDSVRLDLALSAAGRFSDPFSYTGAGNVTLAGPELGEVRLLGLLSDLLQFTALRFTTARGDFRVEGPTVVFASFNATGANSAVHAHGDYSLDRGTLDFNARVYPFLESKSLLQNVVGAVLTPLSTMLEVKLTGALDDPKWAFVMGPTNLFRSLSQPLDPGTPLDPPPQTPSPNLPQD